MSALLAGVALSGPGDVKFLPYLAGERTPHDDAFVRGGFTGLGKQTGVREMVQAVVEGVCYALRDCLEAINRTGTAPQRLVAIGGGTASEFWLMTLATVLNIPLEVPVAGGQREFGAALGAARLATLGLTGRPSAEVLLKPTGTRIIHPNAALQERYEEGYRVFVASYAHLKALQG